MTHEHKPIVKSISDLTPEELSLYTKLMARKEIAEAFLATYTLPPGFRFFEVNGSRVFRVLDESFSDKLIFYILKHIHSITKFALCYGIGLQVDEITTEKLDSEISQALKRNLYWRIINLPPVHLGTADNTRVK